MDESTPTEGGRVTKARAAAPQRRQHQEISGEANEMTTRSCSPPPGGEEVAAKRRRSCATDGSVDSVHFCWRGEDGSFPWPTGTRPGRGNGSASGR